MLIRLQSQNSIVSYFNKLIRTERPMRRHCKCNGSKPKVPTVLNTGYMNISICSEEVAGEKLSPEEFKCPEREHKNHNISKKKLTSSLTALIAFFLASSVRCLLTNTDICKNFVMPKFHH